MFPVILALDQLWAVAPFLLAEKIGFGAAFAATAALLYVPFSERTLVRLAYPSSQSRTLLTKARVSPSETEAEAFRELEWT